MNIKDLRIYKYFNFSSSIGLPEYEEQKKTYWEIRDYWKTLPTRDDIDLIAYFKFCRKRRKGKFESRSIECFFEFDVQKHASDDFLAFYNKLKSCILPEKAIKKLRLINYNVYKQ
jgi:hypothetical protein